MQLTALELDYCFAPYQSPYRASIIAILEEALSIYRPQPEDDPRGAVTELYDVPSEHVGTVIARIKALAPDVFITDLDEPGPQLSMNELQLSARAITKGLSTLEDEANARDIHPYKLASQLDRFDGQLSSIGCCL